MAVVSAASLGLPEPAEDAPDFVGNARIKAMAAATASELPALADDSGFCAAALGGRPGVLSARWAGPGKDFSKAMARVNAELADLGDDRVWFICALCLAWPMAPWSGRRAARTGLVTIRSSCPPGRSKPSVKWNPRPSTQSATGHAPSASF